MIRGCFRSFCREYAATLHLCGTFAASVLRVGHSGGFLTRSSTEFFDRRAVLGTEIKKYKKVRSIRKEKISGTIINFKLCVPN